MAHKAFVVGANTLGLKYCVDDAERLQASLTRLGYDTVLPQGNKSSVQAAFESMVDDAAQTDTLLLYFSGHGLLERGKLWFLLANDATRLANKININECLEAFSNCRASNKLVILDCCHATQGTEDLQIDLSEQYLVLAASARLEKSQEIEALGAGFFTYSLCQTLGGPSEDTTNSERGISVQQLYKWMVDKAKKHNGANEGQVPIPKLLGTHVDFVISTQKSVEAPSTQEANSGAQHLLAIEERYRQLLLDSCDIVTLANLPEQDRHLAMRPLELRRLYVPLHVWVDFHIGEDSKESEWEEIEKRRATSLGAHFSPRPMRREKERAPVGERLTRSRRLVVLGDPGAGKTTLTRWIATAYLLRLKGDANWRNLPDVNTLPDADLLPIIVRCRDLSANCLSGVLDDILRHVLRKTEMPPGEAVTLQQHLLGRLADGTALLVFDGLDEITDPGLRARFCQQLEQINVAYPGAPMIITSRIVGYREMGYRMGRGFEHVTLADLEQREKDDFARRWCDLTEPPDRRGDAARELIHDIHSADRIERLTGNPMLLTTMALVKRKVGKLPRRRADLYGEAVQVLLNWRREIDEPLEHHEAIPQLEYVAYAMCDRGVQQLRRDEILDLITRMRLDHPNVHQARNRTPEEFLTRLESRTGLLVEAGRVRNHGMEETVFEFRHLTFQEYLAARALVDGRFPGREMGRSLADHVAPLAGRTVETTFADGTKREVGVVENWREALRLCVAICRDTEVDDVLTAIAELRREEATITLRARTILAALCIADEPNVGAALVLKVFKELSVFIADEQRVLMTGLRTAAEEVADTRWGDLLLECLMGDFLKSDQRQRKPLGIVVGLVYGKNSLSGMSATSSWLARQAQVLQDGIEVQGIRAALGIAATEWAEPMERLPIGLTDILVERLRGSSPLAYAAAKALTFLHGSDYSSGIAFMSDYSWTPTDSDIQRIVDYVTLSTSDSGAVGYLSNILGSERVEQAFDPLLSWIDHSDDDLVSNVAEALSRIDGQRAVEPLVSLLRHSIGQVRSVAIECLADHDGGPDLESLIGFLKDSDVTVRVAAIRAIGKKGDTRVIATLAAQLEDQNSEVRSIAAWVLGDMKSELAISPLILRLKDQNEDVRISVAQALARILIKHSINALQSSPEDEDAVVRVKSEWVLGEQEAEQLILSLISLLDDENERLRDLAARSIGALGDERAVEPLTSRLVNINANVRSAAAQALGYFGNQGSFDSLVVLLKDATPNVRGAAARALGRLANETATEPLIALLEDSSAVVRSAAAWALGDLKCSRALMQLVVRLQDSEPNVRSAAAKALGLLRDDRALDPLIVRLADSDAYVRESVAQALEVLNSERSIDPLLPLLEDANAWVRSSAAMALGRTNNSRAIEALFARLSYGSSDARRMAVAGLSRGIDQESRILLSRDLDGTDPFIDPRRAISVWDVETAARKLDLSSETVQMRYEALAPRFNLHLSWKSSESKLLSKQ